MKNWQGTQEDPMKGLLNAMSRNPDDADRERHRGPEFRLVGQWSPLANRGPCPRAQPPTSRASVRSA
ncbi:hypothetical protein GCM10010275_36850 [Streptomyces litmocidini]|nr:hypothetical protein GCM10010275_36850 [Streptomyces litmocidini]